LDGYIRNRYGKVTPENREVWQILKKTAYNGTTIRDGAESILTGRPTFDSTTIWTRTKLNYPPKELLPAWQLMMKSIAANGSKEGFQYDLVDISRQVLANYALPLQKKWVTAYRKNDWKLPKICSRISGFDRRYGRIIGNSSGFSFG
jgi:alpha-N-acetylglucosaminidase